jgi:two-component system, NarL family, response regulator NreC
MISTIKVLLTDDHAIVREGLKLMLEAQSNIKVVAEAEDGLDAIAKVRAHRPDIVVMDIAMPNMNGIEATKRIKEEFPETRIIILSMYSTLEDIFRALHGGAIGYLLKDSAGAEVVDAVNAAYNNRRYLSRKVDDMLIDSYIFESRKTKTQSPLDSLSAREREVMQLLAEGKPNPEIARMLFLSVKTVETYRSRLMSKLGISDLASLVKFAIQHGLTS